LHVHPNTLRHRLRRYEQATGASLRRQADLVELWWALERRRLD
jgi:DNA-binding PucR family transcriptional regulator